MTGLIDRDRSEESPGMSFHLETVELRRRVKELEGLIANKDEALAALEQVIGYAIWVQGKLEEEHTRLTNDT